MRISSPITPVSVSDAVEGDRLSQPKVKQPQPCIPINPQQKTPMPLSDQISERHTESVSPVKRTPGIGFSNPHQLLP